MSRFCMLLSLIWLAIIWFLTSDPSVSLDFPEGQKVSVRQVVDRPGHFHLEVIPKEAAKCFTSMTIGGVSLFPMEWLVANVSSSVPLGESEIVDFPRFFELLPKLFLVARITLALLPICLLMFFGGMRHVMPIVKQRCGRKTFVVTSVLTTVFSLPEPIVDSVPGLDSSWGWFLSRFAFRNVFGSDVVFTYGPLGFLLNPQDSWGCVTVALMFNVIFCVLWLSLLLNIFNQSFQGRKVACLLLASSVISVAMEWKWVLLAVLYAAVPVMFSVQLGKERLWNWIIAGVLAAVVSLMKFSSLTIVLGTQCFCLISYAFKFRFRALRDVTIFVAVFAVSFAMLSVICFSSLNALIAWIRGSLATASGYNLYMVAEKPWFELLVPVALLLFFFSSVGWRRSLLFVPILFLTAKYAWVRQTCGPMAYSLALLSAVCLLNGCNNVCRVVGLTIVAFFLNTALALPSALSGLADIQSAVGFKPRALYRTLTLKESVAASFARSKACVVKWKVPAHWRERIGTNSVVFLPHEHAPAMADPTLKLIPLPTLQLYSACHPYLDELNATFFADHVPDFIVCEISAGACGNFINYPRMWKALLEHYECIGHEGRFALLKPRGTPRIAPEESITLADDLTIFEKFRGVFVRNPIEYAELVGKDGRRTRIQFVRGNQRIAFPLAWIPIDDDEMLAVLLGKNGCVATIDL